MILKTQAPVDEYTQYVSDYYDVKFDGEVKTEIPDFNVAELEGLAWNIGCIVGDSGSGKSTILNKIGKVFVPQYEAGKSVVSQFSNHTPSEAVDILQSVGLSSIPTYFHKPSELSFGERHRLDVAMALASGVDIIMVDEFTSVVNRACAKSLSYALQRYVRNNGLKVIVASCHFDIIEWLMPNWVFNLSKRFNGKCEIEYFKSGYAAYKKIEQSQLLSKEVAI